jgi:hypothetical protein
MEAVMLVLEIAGGVVVAYFLIDLIKVFIRTYG